jgi:hypothetical protein
MSALADRYYWTVIPELDRLPAAVVEAARAMDAFAVEVDRLGRKIALMQHIERQCAGMRRRQSRRGK